MNDSGVLLIDKPEGPSSAQVVFTVKRILGAKKVGHLGTLDPFASGLLPLGINEATKISGVFLHGPKSYRGVVKLGIETDTQDATGNVVKVWPIGPITDETLDSLERRFMGDLQQVPPMFSALKRNGVRLYRLARQGQTVPREPRTVRVVRLKLKRLNTSEFEFEVTCSHGTYVRTLASDMGQTLGCGGHLKSLRRISCDHLTVNQATTLENLERLNAEARVPLMSLNAVLSHIPGVTLDNRTVLQLRDGRQDPLMQLPRPANDQHKLRIQDAAGNLIALAEWNQQVGAGRWRLCRVFHA